MTILNAKLLVGSSTRLEYGCGGGVLVRRRFSLKRWMYVVEQMYCRFQDDEVTALSAQLTYYLILSFFPFLIFLLTVLSYTPLASDKTLWNWLALLPESTYRIVADILNETIRASSRTLLSVGMLATIWTSSSGMMAIIRGINKAYDTEENRAFWKVRALAIVYTLVLALLVMLTFGLLVFGERIGEQLFIWLHLPGKFAAVWEYGKVVFSIFLMIVVFALLYTQIPNYPVTVRHALPGALFAATGWICASLAFSYYVNQFGNYARTYGSIGGVIVLLIWIYISSIIILLGGELNAVLQFMKEGRTKAECKKYGFSLPFLRSHKKVQNADADASKDRK